MNAVARTNLEPFASETLTVAGAATPVDQTKACRAIMAEVNVEAAEIRYWKDGSAPTVTDGILSGPGQVFVLYSQEITLLRAIRTGGTNATLQITYYRQKAGTRSW